MKIDYTACYRNALKEIVITPKQAYITAFINTNRNAVKPTSNPGHGVQCIGDWLNP